MTTWNREEFYDLCKQNGISEPTLYFESLNWHLDLANFHKDNAKVAWEDLFKLPFSTSDEKFDRALYSYEYYAVTSVLFSHQMADILDQIINIVILKAILSEDKVNANNIERELSKLGSATKIVNSRDTLRKSYGFLYLSAFCNIVKHRSLINISKVRTSGPRWMPIFKEFVYNGKTYPETRGEDILDGYLNHINELIVKVGLDINDYLK